MSHEYMCIRLNHRYLVLPIFIIIIHSYINKRPEKEYRVYEYQYITSFGGKRVSLGWGIGYHLVWKP